MCNNTGITLTVVTSADVKRRCWTYGRHVMPLKVVQSEKGRATRDNDKDEGGMLKFSGVVFLKTQLEIQRKNSFYTQSF